MLESPSIKRAVPANIEVQHPNVKPATSLVSAESPNSRTQLQAYVEVPQLRKEFLTPSRKGKMRAREDDSGMLGSISWDENSPQKHVTNGIVSSGRRATGDRDDRGKFNMHVTAARSSSAFRSLGKVRMLCGRHF